MSKPARTGFLLFAARSILTNSITSFWSLRSPYQRVLNHTPLLKSGRDTRLAQLLKHATLNSWIVQLLIPKILKNLSLPGAPGVMCTLLGPILSFFIFLKDVCLLINPLREGCQHDHHCQCPLQQAAGDPCSHRVHCGR